MLCLSMPESDASQSTVHDQQLRRQTRPKSAVYQAVEDKVFLLDRLHHKQQREEQPDTDQHDVSATEKQRDNEEEEDDEDEKLKTQEQKEEEQQIVAYDRCSRC